MQCREQAHFHCCYCSKTVIRKVQIIKHLQVCTKRQVPPTETVETAAIIEPVATSEPIIPSNEEVSFKEPAVAEGVSLPVKFPPVLKNVRIQKKVQCVHCGVTVNIKNLDVHVKRKHTKKICDVTENPHLPSQCIDPVSGIYAVEKSFYRPCSVIQPNPNPAATASYWTPAATALYWTPAATASYWTPAATASYCTPAATASDGTPGSVARLMHAEREIKDFRRWEGPITLVNFLLTVSNGPFDCHDFTNTCSCSTKNNSIVGSGKLWRVLICIFNFPA